MSVLQSAVSPEDESRNRSPGSGSGTSAASTRRVRSSCFAIGAIVGLGIAGLACSPPRARPPMWCRPRTSRSSISGRSCAPISSPRPRPRPASRSAKTTFAERLKVLDEMVREELFVQRALELDFPGTDPDSRTALVAAVEQQVVADVTTHPAERRRAQEILRGAPRKYATEGTMVLHNLLLPCRRHRVRRRSRRPGRLPTTLRAGRAPEEVEKTYGMQELVPEHAGEEQFYFAEKIHLGDALFAQAVRSTAAR